MQDRTRLPPGDTKRLLSIIQIKISEGHWHFKVHSGFQDVVKLVRDLIELAGFSVGTANGRHSFDVVASILQDHPVGKPAQTLRVAMCIPFVPGDHAKLGEKDHRARITFMSLKSRLNQIEKRFPQEIQQASMME